MKIKFDPNQRYQLDAIFAVTDLFDGHSLAGGTFETRLSGTAGELFTELGVGNSPRLSEERLLENLRGIQRRNKIEPIDELQGLHFSVEMETSTGKTYVYLRTIYELNKRYGFKKFIIVVPSVAIREGVQKNIELTRDHFRDIYGHVPLDSWVYDSRQVSRLRQFAGSNHVQVLIINIDAFNKAANNVIHRENDRLSGRNPIEFIQSTQPILILDEPQNMESPKACGAIRSLNPLCTLRCSATHRNVYNLAYRLDPVRAYDLKLVKRIEIDAVLDDPDFNRPYVHLKSIKGKASGITARIELDMAAASGPRRKVVVLKGAGADLKEHTGRDVYDGYVVEEINAGDGFLSFANGVTLGLGDVQGGYTDDVMRVRVFETVKEHLEKELRVLRNLPQGQRLKVLSLFFIDRVANYVEVALEELVVNMLLHRDYFISAPWRVMLFDNRIELISPGSLPNDVTVENIRNGVSNIRNPLITSFAPKELPYRGIGTGIRRALAAVPRLELESDHERNLFAATIPRSEE